MDKKYQRILVGVFSLVFFITAPLIILYALGFRFDDRKFQFVETGSLVIRSYPKDVLIELDGKPTNKTTPAVISHIVPGTHRVRLELPEYAPWEKDIFISPQVTTFAEHIQLFPAILMQDPISSTLSTENFFPSHRLRYAVEIQKNEIVLKNIQTPIGTSIEQRTIANLAPREIFSDLLWAKSEKKIFLKTSNRAIVFVISRNDQLVDIKKMLNFLPDKCEWHPSDDALLLCARKKELWLVDIALMRSTLLYTGTIAHPRIDEYTLFLPIHDTTSSSKNAADTRWVILTIDLKNPHLPPYRHFDIPIFEQDAEFKVGKNYYSIYFPLKQQWFLLPRNIQSDETKFMPIFSFTSEKVEHLTWNGNHTKALYINKGVLWYLDTAFQQFVPPVELGNVQPGIQSLVWMPGDRHILVVYTHAVDVIETDLNTPPLTRTLIQRATPINPIEPLTDGKWLYLHVSDGSHPGVVRFRIRP